MSTRAILKGRIETLISSFEAGERIDPAARDGLMVEFGGEGSATPALMFSAPTRS